MLKHHTPGFRARRCDGRPSAPELSGNVDRLDLRGQQKSLLVVQGMRTPLAFGSHQRFFELEDSWIQDLTRSIRGPTAQERGGRVERGKDALFHLIWRWVSGQRPGAPQGFSQESGWGRG